MVFSMARVLLAFDKFKGSLTAMEACEAAVKGVRRALPSAECLSSPVADGGEGTLDALEASLHLRRHTIEVPNAVGSRSVSAAYLLTSSPEPSTAFLELAQASGLTLLSENERNPLLATTYGTGLVMRAALEAGAEKLVIGLGGSATNDGGVGVAQAFGFTFTDRRGSPVHNLPRDLVEVRHIVPPQAPTGLRELVVLTDVDNPLLGPTGATSVYGPQKGVTREMATQLEAGLAHLADLALRAFGKDLRDSPGAGAAGGCAFGLTIFLNGKIEPGFAYLSKLTCLEDAVREADLILVGEGRLDRQTLCGKAPLGVAEMARKHGRPIIAIGGRVDSEVLPELESRFQTVVSLTNDKVTIDEAQQHASHWLEERTFESAQAWLSVTRSP